MNKGEKLAASFRPFISGSQPHLTEADFAKAINNSFQPEIDLLKELAALNIRAEHSPHQVNLLVSKARKLLMIDP